MTTCEAYGLFDGLIIPCFNHVSKHFHTSACSCTGIVQWGRYTGLFAVTGIVCLSLSQYPKSPS